MPDSLTYNAALAIAIHRNKVKDADDLAASAIGKTFRFVEKVIATRGTAVRATSDQVGPPDHMPNATAPGTPVVP